VHADDAKPWECPNVAQNVAVIKVTGPLEHHGGWWFDSYESILSRVEGAMLDDDVSAIILDIDSPGGEVSGLNETVKRIRAMRAQYGKKIVAYADDEAYSAAYALACSADEIYIPESGGVGSIGVIAELVNLQGAAEKQGVEVTVIRSGNRKADGHPFLPHDDATIARVQSRVDGLAKQFFALVSQARPATRKDLEALQGACIYGKRAVNAGLADGIASFNEVLAGLSEEAFDNSPSSAVSYNPNDRSVETGDGENAMAFEVLKKKVAAAARALEAATTPAAKKKAMAAYAAAAEALADARAKAKVKKTYNKKTVEEETEEDDGEPDDDDGDDDSSGDASAEDDDADEDASEEDEEEEEDEKKVKKGKKAASSIVAFVKNLTGQSSMKSAKEVLASMQETAQAAALATERVAKLEAAATDAKREVLIREMVDAGQIAGPHGIELARKQSIASLKAMQKMTPARFAPRAPSPNANASVEEAPDADGVTAFERKLCAEQGISIESYKKTRDANGAAIAPKVN
jgi:signal peptide peptidase SppA